MRYRTTHETFFGPADAQEILQYCETSQPLLVRFQFLFKKESEELWHEMVLKRPVLCI